MKCRWIACVLLLALQVIAAQAAASGVAAKSEAEESDQWAKTTIFMQEAHFSSAGRMAARMLAEEVEKRTGFHWSVSAEWPEEGNVIILKKAAEPLNFPLEFAGLPEVPSKAESYRIASLAQESREFILIEGIDDRGVLFGAGRLLRLMRFQRGPSMHGAAGTSRHEGALRSLPDTTSRRASTSLVDSANPSSSLRLPASINLSASPAVPIRGHQLGYRNTANSYDGWTPEMYEQYIRELVVFGANSIETIPFDKGSPHFTLPPREMNISISEICRRYGLDYWMWTPADFDLNDQEKKEAFLKQTEQLYKDLPRLDNVFFPGGDPGDNPPELVMPFLETLSVLLKKYHPEARIWLSLQGFSPEMSNYVYTYIRDEMPEWLGGLVAGPSSPPLKESREALPAQYGLRHYPDITHTVRCQYPVPWWDPAFNFTLGREPVNPRPSFYSRVYRESSPYTSGFITYSDGIHDDVNKIVWNQLGWDPDLEVREILKQYAAFFFGADIASEAADAILALEKNWEGPVAANGSIEGTLHLWQDIQQKKPALAVNWRWQMHLMRAYYDAYTRRRAIYEGQLEDEVNQVLLKAREKGPGKATEEAKIILARASEWVKPAWRKQIIDLCGKLFQSVCLQTSVEKYQAKNPERGAVLDFLDRPLNNRWWLEDQFKRIDSLQDPEQQIRELEALGKWENPDPGSYYDDVGNVSKSPHVIRGEGSDIPGFDWWDDGYSRARLSWMVSMRWPQGMRYKHLDPEADYVIRATGYGECLLRANGQRLKPSSYGKGIGEIKEFPVPRELLENGELLLTWDEINEEHLNWRQHSRLTEVWLIKQ